MSIDLIINAGDNANTSIVMDTFANILWYIIGAVIFCICFLSILLLYYVHQTRKFHRHHERVTRPISESLHNKDISYNVQARSNSYMDHHLHQHHQHIRHSRFKGLSGLNSPKSPKSPTNSRNSSRSSKRNRNNNKKRRVRARKIAHKRSKSTSTTHNELSTSSESDEDEDSMSSSTTRTAPKDRTDDVGQHLVSPNNSYPHGMLSASSMGSTTTATTARTVSYTHTKNPMSISVFSAVDSEGVDMRQDENNPFMDMPPIEEVHNERGSIDSTLNSSPSPRSAGNGDSDASNHSQPARKITDFNKGDEYDKLMVNANNNGHNGNNGKKDNAYNSKERIRALNQDLSGNEGGGKSGASGASSGDSSNNTESDDDETENAEEESKEVPFKRKPLEEQMQFAQEFLYKQQEAFLKYQNEFNQREDSEADLKSETPDTTTRYSDMEDNTPIQTHQNINDIPLSIFSALSAVSMKMKQFETNDMIPNGNLTSLNAEPSIYSDSDNNNYYHNHNDTVDGDGDGGVGIGIDGDGRLNDGDQDSDESSFDPMGGQTIIAMMKKNKTLNLHPMDYKIGTDRLSVNSGCSGSSASTNTSNYDQVSGDIV